MKSAVEAGKKMAAVMAVDKYIQNNQRIGIGSGSTIVHAVERLAERVKSEGLQVQCVATSFQARGLIVQHGLPLSDLYENVDLDVAIDGADEVDARGNCIKGGGGCLTQEKIVASAARCFVVVADVRCLSRASLTVHPLTALEYTKKAAYLGEVWRGGVPIEVIPMSHALVTNTIETRLGGSVNLRMAVSKMGPVVTDNGNFIVDWKFDEERAGAGDNPARASTSRDWQNVNVQLKIIPGVVETGLFIGMTDHVILGTPEGAEEMLTE